MNTSGLLCYSGLDGHLSPWWLLADVIAFGMATARVHAAAALQRARLARPDLHALLRSARDRSREEPLLATLHACERSAPLYHCGGRGSGV